MGRRMGSQKKNYLPLAGRPVLAHTLAAFESSDLVDAIVIVVPHADEEFCRTQIVEKYGFKKVADVIAGGKERQDSVTNALKFANDRWEFIAIHDGARPLVTKEIIDNTIKAAYEHGAAICAVPVKDTIKEALGGFIQRTVPREALLSVQTPQIFRADIIKKAFTKAIDEGFLGTDESSLVERIGCQVKVVEGSYENIKITTKEDMAIAECIIHGRGAALVR